MDKSRSRLFTESNYAAIFDGKQTFRFELNGGPIKSPPYPEFYDIAINNLCYAGCTYCYVAATAQGRNFDNVLGKIEGYFGKMTPNQRPFQVAIGGHGEPTLHPDFVEVLKLFRGLGIVPNYTTNGMHLTQAVRDATREYAGGVAVSAHDHLAWESAVKILANYTEVHLHCIVSDRASVERFFDIHDSSADFVSTFVLLPYQAVGRAVAVDTDFAFLLDLLEEKQLSDVAYGAYFYDDLKKRPRLKTSLYEPHMFSRYLVLDDPIGEYKSSFDVRL